MPELQTFGGGCEQRRRAGNRKGEILTRGMAESKLCLANDAIIFFRLTPRARAAITCAQSFNILTT
jgi:hypothetical protein